MLGTRRLLYLNQIKYKYNVNSQAKLTYSEDRCNQDGQAREERQEHSHVCQGLLVIVAGHIRCVFVSHEAHDGCGSNSDVFAAPENHVNKTANESGVQPVLMKKVTVFGKISLAYLPKIIALI